MTRKAKRVLTRIAMFALAIIIGMFSLSACGVSGDSWQEQYDLGVRYLSEGNYEEAIIAFTAAIEIDPNRAEAYVGRGDAYIGSGETEDNLAAALADYEEAVALDETNVAAWLGLADVYICRGDYEKALEVLQRGFEITEAPELSQRLDEVEAQRTTAAPNSGLAAWYDSRQGIEAEVWALSSATFYIPDGRWFETLHYSYDEQGRLVRRETENPAENRGERVIAEIWEEDPEAGTWTSKLLWEYEDGHLEEETNLLDAVVHIAGEGPLESLGSAALHAYFPDFPLESSGTFYFNAYPQGEADSLYMEPLLEELPGAEVQYTFDEVGNVSRVDLYDGTGNLHSYAELTFDLVPVLQ